MPERLTVTHGYEFEASLGYLKVYLKKWEGLGGGRRREGEGREGNVNLNVGAGGNWNSVALKSSVLSLSIWQGRDRNSLHWVPARTTVRHVSLIQVGSHLTLN